MFLVTCFLLLLVVVSVSGQNVSSPDASVSINEGEADFSQRLDERTVSRLRSMFRDSHQLATDQAREMSMSKTLKHLKERFKHAKKDKDKDRRDEYDAYDEYYDEEDEKERKKHKKDHKKHKYEMRFGGFDQPFARFSKTDSQEDKDKHKHRDDYERRRDRERDEHGSFRREPEAKSGPNAGNNPKNELDMYPPVSSVGVPPSLLSQHQNHTSHSEARQSSFLTGLHLPGTNPLGSNPLANNLFQSAKPFQLPTMPSFPPLPSIPMMTPKPPPQPKSSIIGNNGGPMSLTNDNVVVVNVLSNNW